MMVYPFGVGGSVTRVLEDGAGAMPLLFLHGLTSRADRFVGTLKPFAEAGYHVYAIDLPGHGFASKSADFDHSVTGYRDFVLAFLDRIGASRAALVGASLGGHILAAVACRAPERVEKLVMVGSLGLGPVTSERVRQMRAGLGDMTPAGVRGRLLNVFSDPRLVTEALVEEDARVNTSPGARESFERFFDYMDRRFNDDLVLEALSRLGARVPLLLLWGEEDRSVPVEVGRAARGALPDAMLATIARVNHTPYIENPAAFNGIVLSFLQGRLRALTAPDVTCN
jgi:2-hydroxy-6-oxonona-2,4-dienedioate hydrolase